MMLLLASDLRRCRHCMSYRLLSLLTERVSAKLVMLAQPQIPTVEAKKIQTDAMPCLCNNECLIVMAALFAFAELPTKGPVQTNLHRVTKYSMIGFLARRLPRMQTIAARII